MKAFELDYCTSQCVDTSFNADRFWTISISSKANLMCLLNVLLE